MAEGVDAGGCGCIAVDVPDWTFAVMMPSWRDTFASTVQIRDEQLRLHRSTLLAAVAGSATLGLILTLVLAPMVGAIPAWGWFTCLLASLAGRLWVYRWQDHQAPELKNQHYWIARFRRAALVHGLVWAMASVLLFPMHDPTYQLFLVFALAGICVSALSGYSFDLKAALSLCGPVLIAVLLRLLAQGNETSTAIALMLAMFMTFVMAIALRAHRALCENLGLRANREAQHAALSRSHERLSRAETLAGQGSFTWYPADGRLEWSDGHFRLWGISPGSVTPNIDLFRQAIDPADLARVQASLQQAMAGADVPDCQFRVNWPDGSLHQMLGRGVAVHDAAGQVVALTGTVQDVTERQQTLTRLAEKQQLLTVMQQTTQLGFWIVDAQGLTTDANPALCELLGLAREQVLGRNIQALVDADYAGRVRASLAGAPTVDATVSPVELARPDGTVRDCLGHHTVLLDAQGHVIGLVAMLSDFSAIERARQAQHVSEFVVNALHDMVSVIDLDGRYRFVNSAWCRRMGQTQDAVIGRTIEEVVPEVMTQERRQAMHDCAVHGEIQVLRTQMAYDGLGTRSMETTMTPYVNRESTVLGLVAVTRDISDQLQAQEALAQSLENLRRIFNGSGDGMFAYEVGDQQGRLLFVNECFLDMWDMPRNLTRPYTRYDVMAAARKLFVDPSKEERRIAEILASREVHTDRLVLRDGRILERRCMAMQYPEGPTRIWTMRDITLQEQALHALHASDGQQRALMDAFPGYVSVIDQNFVYTYVNARTASLFGVPADTLIGQHILPFVGEQRYQLTREDIARLREGPNIVTERHYEAVAPRPEVYLQVTQVMGARGQGDLQRYYAFGIDITDLKRAEEAMRAAKDEAERANRAKSAFLASVSHELRTPLNAILGFSQLLRAQAQVSPLAGDNAGEIERAGRHLLSLVDDLIELGGVEAGQLELTMAPVAVESVINGSLSMVAPLAANQGIRIVFDGGSARHAVVSADAVRLRQIIINLLSNAIKYNRPDGTVRVSCTYQNSESTEGNGPVRIAVRDTGTGIEPAMASRVFSAFERLGAERGQIEGTGIGLAISRRLVSAMGGRIGFDSRVREGSTFWIDLPSFQSLAAAAQKPGVPHFSPGPKLNPRVLVAEDYGPNQAVLMQQLRILGCEVDVVNDGVAALARYQEKHYALILSDLDMPHMGGHDLARAIRAQDGDSPGERVPIIAISAAVVAGERGRCMAAGMDDMLTKPISLEALRAMLHRWLKPGEGAFHAVDVAAAPIVAGGPARDLSQPEPVLDLDALYQVLGKVSTEKARDLVATFLASAEGGLRALARSGQAKAQVAREMHRQIASARTVGAMRYARRALALEQAALTQDAVLLAAPLRDLHEALEQVRVQAGELERQAPMSMPVPLQAETPDEPPVDAVVTSVLVVDDDPVVLMQMQQMLANIGVQQVRTARDGVEAIALMANSPAPVDVVVCDLNMPEMDGVEMIRRFSQSGFHGALVLMSGADEQLLKTVGNLAQLQGLNVLGQVQKPATPQRMRALLRRTIAAAAGGEQASGSGSPTTPQAILAGIRDQAFSIWFQPKVDAHSLVPVGVEALARWRQADGSFVSPHLFIVAAERAGIIGQLSGVLLQLALREAAALRAAGYPMAISLNLSALWLDDLNLPDLLLQSALEQGLRPADITFEVTETGVTKDIAIALDVLTRLRLKGFSLSIDDFGIGYSSFEQLGRIPFTEMKLDRSFVQRSTHDAAARAILESSMAMAGKLMLRTVAEGVETECELELMRELGFDEVQGYLIARPMPRDELLRWLSERRRSQAA